MNRFLASVLMPLTAWPGCLVVPDGTIRDCRDFRVRAGMLGQKESPMARRKAPRIADAVLDERLAGADPTTVVDPDGLLDALKRRRPSGC